MADTIAVLNAGSSSLKFSIFLDGEPPELLLHGQIEGIGTRPHFVARDAAGHVVGEREWAPGAPPGA
jgi:acetate kinase